MSLRELALVIFLTYSMFLLYFLIDDYITLWCEKSKKFCKSRKELPLTMSVLFNVVRS